MSFKCDDRRFVAEPDNSITGDSIEACSYGERGDIHIRIDEPWAGDTEKGFGRNCGFTLSKDDAIALANWIIGRLQDERK